LPCEVPDDLLNEIEVALICEKFHKLPSEILRENPREMRRVWSVLNEIDRIRNMKSSAK